MTNPSPNVWTWARWSPGRSTAIADQWRPSLERHVPGSTVPAATQPAAPWATDQPANAVAASTSRTAGSAGSVQLTASFEVHATGSPLATHSPRKPPPMRATKPGAGSATRRHPQPPVSKSNAAEAEAVGEVSAWLCRAAIRAAPPPMARTIAAVIATVVRRREMRLVDPLLPSSGSRSTGSSPIGAMSQVSGPPRPPPSRHT